MEQLKRTEDYSTLETYVTTPLTRLRDLFIVEEPIKRLRASRFRIKLFELDDILIFYTRDVCVYKHESSLRIDIDIDPNQKRKKDLVVPYREALIKYYEHCIVEDNLGIAIFSKRPFFGSTTPEVWSFYIMGQEEGKEWMKKRDSKKEVPSLAPVLSFRAKD